MPFFNFFKNFLIFFFFLLIPAFYKGFALFLTEFFPLSRVYIYTLRVRVQKNYRLSFPFYQIAPCLSFAFYKKMGYN